MVVNWPSRPDDTGVALDGRVEPAHCLQAQPPLEMRRAVVLPEADGVVDGRQALGRPARLPEAATLRPMRLRIERIERRRPIERGPRLLVPAEAGELHAALHLRSRAARVEGDDPVEEPQGTRRIGLDHAPSTCARYHAGDAAGVTAAQRDRPSSTR